MLMCFMQSYRSEIWPERSSSSKCPRHHGTCCVKHDAFCFIYLLPTTCDVLQPAINETVASIAYSDEWRALEEHLGELNKL